MTKITHFNTLNYGEVIAKTDQGEVYIYPAYVFKGLASTAGGDKFLAFLEDHIDQAKMIKLSDKGVNR